MTIIIIIILGLIALALLLLAQFKRGAGGGGDAISLGLEHAIRGARDAINAFPASPAAADCDNLKAALQTLENAIGSVPDGLPKYTPLKTAAEGVRDAIKQLLADRCQG